MSYDLQFSFHKPHIVSWTTKIWYQYYKWCVIFCTSACLKTFASDRKKKDFLILHYIEPFSLNIDISVINESRSRFLSILKVQSFCTYEPFSYKDTGLQNQSQLRLIEVKKVPLVIAFWYKWSEEKVVFLTLFVPSIKCQKFVREQWYSENPNFWITRTLFHFWVLFFLKEGYTIGTYSYKLHQSAYLKKGPSNSRPRM